MMKRLRRAMATRSASNSASASGLSTCLVRDTFCCWSSPKPLPAPLPSLSALAQYLADCLREIERSRNGALRRHICGSLSGAVEPTRCQRRVGADDRRLRLGGYERPRAAWHLYTGQTAVRSAIVEAFKALPDVNYQPVRNSFGEDHRQVGDEISCRASSINQSLNRRTAGFCSVSDVATT